MIVEITLEGTILNFKCYEVDCFYWLGKDWIADNKTMMGKMCVICVLYCRDCYVDDRILREAIDGQY